MPGALAEMMARSGGFNVPADYFRVSGMPQPVPAMPAGVPKKGRAPLFIAMAVVGTLGIAALAVTLAKPTSSKAQGLVQSVTPVAPVIPPALSSANAAPAASVPAAPSVQHVALVVVDPKDAKVVRTGTSENLNVAMGKQPASYLYYKDVNRPAL